MADVPHPISAETDEDLRKQLWELIRDLYEERVAGLAIGDVFEDSGDVLSLKLVTNGGLEKSSNELQIKLQAGGGLAIGSDGLYATEFTAMTDGQLIVGQTDAASEPKSMSGDATIDKDGAITIGNDKIDSQHYVAGSIDTEHIAADQIDSQHYVADSIDTEHYAPGSVDQAAIGANAVGQSELKTDSQEDSASLGGLDGNSTVVSMTGSAYGFFGVQVKKGAAGTGEVDFTNFKEGTVTTSYEYLDVRFERMTDGDSTASTVYTQQYYVTSSGEVFWYFAMRDKITKEILRCSAGNDHPCFFAESVDPNDTPHPFKRHFNIDEHEIVVAILDKEGRSEIDSIIINNPNKKLSRLQVLNEMFEFDEDNEVDYPDREITVGLPPMWDKAWISGEKVTPIKKVISKPGYIIPLQIKRRK